MPTESGGQDANAQRVQVPQIWTRWVTSGSTNTYMYQQEITWQDTSTGTAIAASPGWQPARESPEDAAARVERERQALAEIEARRAQAREERRRHQEEERRRADEAHARAMELVLICMTPEERERYHATNRIIVTSNLGRMWEITQNGYEGNVNLVDPHHVDEDGQPDYPMVARFCVHPKMYDSRSNERCPTPDAWAGQILHLRHDEDEMIRLANVHGWADEYTTTMRQYFVEHPELDQAFNSSYYYNKIPGVAWGILPGHWLVTPQVQPEPAPAPRARDRRGRFARAFAIAG